MLPLSCSLLIDKRTRIFPTLVTRTTQQHNWPWIYVYYLFDRLESISTLKIYSSYDSHYYRDGCQAEQNMTGISNYIPRLTVLHAQVQKENVLITTFETWEKIHTFPRREMLVSIFSCLGILLCFRGGRYKGEEEGGMGRAHNMQGERERKRANLAPRCSCLPKSEKTWVED